MLNVEKTPCLSLLTPVALAVATGLLEASDLQFEKSFLVPEGAETWWARVHADVNQDGLLDFYVINNNTNGGWLGWFESRPDSQNSVKHIIAGGASDGILFGAGDLDAADVDADGDLDVLSGNNAHQGDPQSSPLVLFINSGDNEKWIRQVLSNGGAYNSYLGDFEGDGDLDIFRYAGHVSESYELWLNKVR